MMNDYSPGRDQVEKIVQLWGIVIVVTLHNDDAPELDNFNRFMTALRKKFENPLTQTAP